jgi:hypothetical protein
MADNEGKELLCRHPQIFCLLLCSTDLLLTEKQSMAQIVCSELAQLTWQSPSDVFLFRLTHLRDLSESWQQYDASKGGEYTVAAVSNASMEEEPVLSAALKAGMVTRSKSGTSHRLSSPTVTRDETVAAVKTPVRSKISGIHRGRPKKTEDCSASDGSSIVIAVPVDETTTSFDLSELMENDEDLASNVSADQSESVNGW